MTIQREQLWVALANLWLDTELSPEQIDAIATLLQKSGLREQELDEIFELELAPFLGVNTWITAGVWTGFDPAWICEQAASHQHQRRWYAWILAKLGISTRAAKPVWDTIKKQVFERNKG